MSEQLDHHLSSKGVMKNTFWMYAVAFIVAPMQYIIRILIAKNLSIEQVGVFYSLMSLTGLLAVYNDLGFKEAIAFFYPQYLTNNDHNKSKTLIITTLCIQIMSSFLLAGGLFFGAPYIAEHYLGVADATIAIQVFGLYLFVYIFYNFIDGIFLIFQDAFRNKMLSLLSYCILCLATFLVPYNIFGFVGVNSNLTGYILAAIIPACIGVGLGATIFVRKYLHSLNKGSFIRNRSDYKSIQLYAFGVLFTNNITYLLSQIDLQFITYMFGSVKAARYSYGMMLTNMTLSLLSPIFVLLYPMVSHYNARGEHERMGKVLYGLLNYLGVIAILSSAFLFIYAKEILGLLFGAEYQGAVSLIQRNIPFVVFAVLGGLLYMVYAGLGMIKDRIKMLIIVLVGSIIGNYVMAKLMGAAGIAFITGVIWMFMFFYSYRDLKKENVPIQCDRLFLGLNAIGAISLGWLLHSIFPFEGGSPMHQIIYFIKVGCIYSGIMLGINIKRLLGVSKILKELIRNN